MCFQITTITSNTRRARTVRWRQANPNNLRPVPLSSTTLLSIPIGLWNCQSAVNKADFIPSIATHSGLSLMALTETWIKPEDTATPAALLSRFTHEQGSQERGDEEFPKLESLITNKVTHQGSTGREDTQRPTNAN